MNLTLSGNTGSQPPFSRGRALIALVLALVAIGVYANAFHNEFALDDQIIIGTNTSIHGVEHLRDAATSSYWPNTELDAALYRPLTQVSYAIGWSLWHGNPHGFHAVNIVLHGLVTVFVFLLLLRLGAPLVASVAGALVFAVHPVHTEAVANVVGRAELLAALFFIGAILEYLAPHLSRWRRALVVGVAFLFALASKENAVVLPGVLVVLEFARRDRAGVSLLQRVKWEWPVAVSMLVALAGFVALRHQVLGVFLGNDTAPYLSVLPAWQRVLTAIRLFPEYVRLAVFPRDLIVEYGPAVILPATGLSAMVVLGFLLGVLAIVVVVASWNRQRLFTVGVLWFALTLVPVSNLFVAVGIMMAERTLYLPSVGWSILVAGVVMEVAHRTRPVERRALAVAGMLLVLLGAWRTWQRNPAWKDSDTVLTDLGEHHPESFRAEWYLAVRLEQEDSVDKSLFYYRWAVARVGPHYPLLYSYAQALLKFHRYQTAIPVLHRIIDHVPEHRDSQLLLGGALAMLGRWQTARDDLQAAVKVIPDDPQLYSLLAIADAQLDNWPAALQARLTSLKYAGGKATPDDWLHLALVRGRLNEMKQAQHAMERARVLAAEAGDTLRVPTLDSLLSLPNGLGVRRIVIP